ncbi:helix-turn-helix domain-containing protein [Flexivirga oryzae]|uniref:HTH cro/C1-type domain-containing protein n=1 Tax=Flexivirga oryzae TaxID=1794944 RepID=A0A839N898_9MICO|nr:helix-turn-helix transcriptional regulator [Flexivirga oryzae]MBB2892234.1 hypothetical protein [Flexivirga oryzae]
MGAEGLDGHAVDPAAIFDQNDLVLQLELLRRRAAVGSGRRRVPLATLGRLSGIPTSTLHTYIRGRSFPPADALDRIVEALGATPREARDWATAWERASDAMFGGGRQPGASGLGRLRRFRREVRRQMTRPTDRAVDRAEYVVLFNRLTVNAGKIIVGLEQRVVLRATGFGVDRDVLQVQSSTDQDVGRLTLHDLVNAHEGSHRSLSEPPVRLMEVLFDRELAVGETYFYEATVRYAPTEGAPEPPSRCALKGFDGPGPSFTLEVCFDPSVRPRRVVQVHRPNFGRGTENIVGELTVNDWGAVVVTAQRPLAGVHGIRWEW